MKANERCPICASANIDLLSTSNEWRYYCGKCDRRFNSGGEVLGEADRAPKAATLAGRGDVRQHTTVA